MIPRKQDAFKSLILSLVQTQAVERLKPAADEFRPDLVMVSAGFDSRLGDPLGQFTLADRDFADLTRVLRDIAAKHSNGRLVSVLEGGYNLYGLTKAAQAHGQALQE